MRHQGGGARRKDTPTSIVVVGRVDVLHYIVYVGNGRGLHLVVVRVNFVKGQASSVRRGIGETLGLFFTSSPAHQVHVTVGNEQRGVGQDTGRGRHLVQLRQVGVRGGHVMGDRLRGEGSIACGQAGCLGGQVRLWSNGGVGLGAASYVLLQGRVRERHQCNGHRGRGGHFSHLHGRHDGDLVRSFRHKGGLQHHGHGMGWRTAIRRWLGVAELVIRILV